MILRSISSVTFLVVNLTFQLLSIHHFSLTLEIAFHYLKKTDFEEIAAMLVVVRLWRFIRIGHVSNWQSASNLFYL